MTPSPAAVTARGIRDGERPALAALVERRGAAVLAYCDHLAAPGRALEAAGEAFAGFRREVRDAEDPVALDPEALLLRATRRAASARAPHPEAPSGLLRRRRAATCQFVPELLAARAEGELSAADRLRLAHHLERCADCQAAEKRFAEAERAYAEAPSTPPEAGVAGGLIAALRAAAPNADERIAPAPEPVAAGPAGNGASAAAPEAEAAEEPSGPPTLSWDPAELLAASSAEEGPRWRGLTVRVAVPAAVAVVAGLTALLVAGAFSGGDAHDAARSIQTQETLPAATVRVLQRPSTTPLPPAEASPPGPGRSTAPLPAIQRPAQRASTRGAAGRSVPAAREVAAPQVAPAATTREHATSLDARANGGTEAAPPANGGAPARDEPGRTPAPGP